MTDQPKPAWRILIVDDDEDDYFIARATLNGLRGRKAHLEWAPSFDAGQKLLQSNQYDAVLVDYDLGPHTGLDLIRQTVAAGYPAPLILYTGRGNYDVDVEAAQAGATLYLTKDEATPLLMERFLRYAIEQKRGQQQLQAAEQKYRLLAENSPDIIYIVDLQNGKTVYMNRETILGYTPEELEASGSLLSRVHPDDRPALQAHWQQVLSGAALAPIEYRLQRKDGRWEWLSSRERILTWDAEGRPSQVMASITLITARKQAAEALRRSEEKYHVVVEALNEGIVLQDRDGAIITCNQAAQDILGLPAEQLLGLTSIDPRWRSIHEDGTPFPGEAHPAMWTLQTGQPQYGVIMGVHKPDGQLTWISIDSQIVHLEPGEVSPDAVLVSFTDITGRKQADAQVALQASLLEQVHNSVIAIDFNNTIIYWNDYATQMYQWTRPEALGQNIIELLAAEENREIADHNFEDLYRDGHWEGIFDVRRKDGSRITAHITNTYLKDAHGANIGFIGISEDITQRLATEQALRERDSLYRSVVHAAMDGFWLADLACHLLEVNEAYCQMSGYTQAELLRMSISDVEASEDPAGTAWHSQQIAAQGRDRFTTRHRRKDGSSFAVEVSVQYQPACGGRLVAFLRALEG